MVISTSCAFYDLKFLLTTEDDFLICESVAVSIPPRAEGRGRTHGAQGKAQRAKSKEHSAMAFSAPLRLCG
jgi:hypothetical protein